MTVAELEDRMGAQELMEWMEFLKPPEQKVPGNLLDMDADSLVAEMTRKK